MSLREATERLVNAVKDHCIRDTALGCAVNEVEEALTEIDGPCFIEVPSGSLKGIDLAAPGSDRGFFVRTVEHKTQRIEELETRIAALEKR